MLGRAAKAVHDTIFRDAVYVSRSGYFEGYRRTGRMPWLLPRRRPDREEAFYRGLDVAEATVYDVGAHTGGHTALLARRAAHVYAFEPEPNAFAELSKLIEMNDVRNVTALAVALGGESGIAEMALPADDGVEMAGTLEPGFQEHLGDAPTVEVPVVALDDLRPLLDLPPPDFVKVDVEGFEDEVLRGARRTVEAHRPTLMVEVHGLTPEDKAAKAGAVLAEVPPDYAVERPFDDVHVLLTPR
jgi:FkbM family methyltransferase